MNKACGKYVGEEECTWDYKDEIRKKDYSVI
jgi:hypothetical protein